MSSTIGQSGSQSETYLSYSILENFRTQSLLRTLAIVTIPDISCVQNIKVCLASQSISRFPERWTLYLSDMRLTLSVVIGTPLGRLVSGREFPREPTTDNKQ